MDSKQIILSPMQTPPSHTPTSLAGPVATVILGCIIFILGSLLAGAELTISGVLVIIICCVLSGVSGAIVASRLISKRFGAILGIGDLIEFERNRLEMEQQRLLQVQNHKVIENRELQRLEAQVNVPEIWIITTNVAFDSEETPKSFKPIVKENSRRGIRYVYVVPDSLGAPAEEALLHGLPKKAVSVRRIAEDKWDKLPYCAGAFILYNPHSKSEHDPCCAYFEFPAAGGNFWAKVDTRLAVQWADRVDRLLKDARSI